MALNLWWSDDLHERYWMEVTDREVLGDDLLAPQLNGAGNEEWSYTLVTEARPGDIVLHWHKRWIGRPALVGWSEVTGPLSIGSITWQARGTRGRARGVASTGASWLMQCGGFHPFDEPVTLADLNAIESTIRRVHDELDKAIRGPVYFPFIFYRPGELRAKQGYLMKFPAALVNAIPSLKGALTAAPAPAPAIREPGSRRTAALSRTQDPKLRAAIERCAVERAKQHYRDLGATEILELGKPYDLSVHGLGVVRHVEVKGSSVSAVAVQLTANEVTHARNYPHTDLVIVDGIQWTRTDDGGYATAGGTLRVYESWQPADEDLAATQFRYELPERS